jgi:prepilin-type N-terminal cleavage/methylation domain-containing protein
MWSLQETPDSHRWTSDSGLTLLEVLIGLVIMAAVAVVVSTSIRIVPPAQPSARETFLAFVNDVASDAKRTGEPQLLLIDSGRASVGAKAVTWAATDLSIDASPLTPNPIRVVLFPDGTVSSPQLTLQSKDGTQLLRLVYRPS